MNATWNDLLARQGLQNNGADFGDLDGELATARDATVLVPLTDLGVIRASGADAAEFLHNMLTNDVKHLATGDARLAGFCTAKGRLLATPLIWREGDDYLLAMSADLLAGVLKKLSMFVLRSKVKLTDAGNEVVLLGVAGKEAGAALAAIGATAPDAMKTAAFAAGRVVGLGNDRFLVAAAADQAEALWQKLAATAKPAGLAAWHWLEIAAGMPRVVAATQEAFVPQMVNLEVVGGVSFTKGCYPGQEIVARAHYLGKVKRRMFRARLQTPEAPGAAVYAPDVPDQAVGNLVEVAPAPGGAYECLVVIQEASAAAGDVRVGAPGGQRLDLLTLPYALPA